MQECRTCRVNASVSASKSARAKPSSRTELPGAASGASPDASLALDGAA